MVQTSRAKSVLRIDHLLMPARRWKGALEFSIPKMARQLTRRNVKMMVLLGVAVLLAVEFVKLVVVVDDYEVEKSSDVDDDRRSQSVREAGGIRSGKTKVLWAGLADEVMEKVEGEEAKMQGEKRPGVDQEQRAEKFRTKDPRIGSDNEEMEFIEMDPRVTGNDGAKDNHEVDALKKIPPKEDGVPVTSKKIPGKKSHFDSVGIYINTSRPVLNPHPFRYIINSPGLCKGVKVFLLCYVHTAVKHVKRRKRIRQTWGNQSNYPGVEIRVVFFVGLPQLNTTEGRLYQDYLAFESKRYGDIVQEDFLDTYKNLSHKGVGALKWISTYCRHTAYVLKTDDDMFVNMYVILNHLRNLWAENFRRRLLMCYVFWLMHVDRQGGQWSLPKDYFPDDLYPPYCSGMGFVVSGDVAIAMYRVSPYVRFLWVDDAFISGVLPAALQGAVNHTSWARTYCAAFEMGVYTHPTEWYKYTFSHVHNETLYLMTWKGLSDIVRNRTIPRPSVITPGHLADDYIPLHKLFSPP